MPGSPAAELGPDLAEVGGERRALRHLEDQRRVVARRVVVGVDLAVPREELALRLRLAERQGDADTEVTANGLREARAAPRRRLERRALVEGLHAGEQRDLGAHAAVHYRGVGGE